jgi:hypothetical protein
LSGTAISVPYKPGKNPFSKNNKTLTNLQAVNHAHVIAARDGEGPTAHITSAARQAASLGPPRANLRLARGSDAPSGESLPRSRSPRACDPRTHSPDPSIKCFGTPRSPGSIGESSPCRPSDIAWESYSGAVPPTRPVRPSLALCGSCAERPVSTPRHCTAHSCTPPTTHPSKEDGRTLERGMDTYPATALDNAVTSDQWGARLRPCVAILVAVLPSRALQHHPRRCGSPGRQDIAIPATVQPPAFVSPTLELTYGR